MLRLSKRSAALLINILYDLCKISLRNVSNFLGISAEQIRRIPGNVLYHLNGFLFIFAGYGVRFLIPAYQNGFVLNAFSRWNNALELMYSCVYLGVHPDKFIIRNQLRVHPI